MNSPGGAGKWSEQGQGEGKVEETKFLPTPIIPNTLLGLAHRYTGSLKPSSSREPMTYLSKRTPPLRAPNLHTFPHPAAELNPLTAEPRKEQSFGGGLEMPSLADATSRPYSHVVARL